MGFSPDGIDEYACPDEQGGWLRRYGPTQQWQWVPMGDAAVFTRRFTAAPYQACSQLTGIGTDGDSGGSLYRLADGTLPELLCGVISGDGPDNIRGTFSTGVQHDYETSATDHFVNIDWLDGLFRDADGFGEGSFESRGNGDDPDGDGIASVHDTCPWTNNPEQLTTHDDPDGDGVGSACDNCFSANDGGVLENLNYEVERAAAEANGLVEPIDPDDFANMAEYEAARVAWMASFRPDACDPTPVPLQSLHEGGDLPIDFPDPPVNCGVGGGGCSLIVRNEIKIDGRTTHAIPAGTSATLGFRFCDCKDAPAGTNTESMVGRLTCLRHPDTSCVYSGVAYDSSANNWQKIVTPRVQANMTWDDVVEGAEWSHAPGTDIETFWDFTQLGDAVVTTSSSQKVKGVLWATFRHLSPSVPAVPTASLRTFGATLGTGDAGWRYKTNGPRQFYPARDEAFCRECPMGLRHPYHEVGYPDDWRVAIEGGSTSFPAPDATTINHYEQVAQGTVQHVTAAEPVRTLAKLFPMGQSFVRSLGVEGGAVTRVLEAHELDALPARVSWSTADPGPATGTTARGYTFSATRQRLYVVGGKLLTGAPLNEAWTLDLATGDWRQFAIPAAESVGAVLAASFRWQDSAVYFLDRSGTSLRLRRWNTGRNLPTGVVQTLATFPAAWNPFNKVDLVQTPGGDMLIVAWEGTSTTKVMVGRLTMSASNTVAMPGIRSSTVSIAAPPGAGLTGYTAMTTPVFGPAPVDPYATSTTYASMTNPHPTLRPTIHPH